MRIVAAGWSLGRRTEAPTQNEWLAFLQERVDGLKGDKETWRRHIADDCIWVGLGMKVAGLDEVAAQQIDSGIRAKVVQWRRAVMTIELDHTIVPCRNQIASAKYLGELLGVPWSESGAAPSLPSISTMA